MRTTRPSLLSTTLLQCVTLVLLGLPLLSYDNSATASPISQIEVVHDSHNAKPILDDPSLSKRANYQAPSTDELVALIDNNPLYKRGARPSVFWSSLYFPGNVGDSYWETKLWGEKRFGAKEYFALYTDFFSDYDYGMLMNYEQRRTEAEKNDFIAHLSKAFARRSGGTVYVVMTDGTEPHDKSVWKVWEAPTLTRQPAGWIDKIIRVGYPSKEETTIWTAGDAALYEPAPPG